MEGIWLIFQKSYGVGNARVSVMAACGQARDGVVEAVLTCQVRDTILQVFTSKFSSSYKFSDTPTTPSYFILPLNFSMRFDFQGDIDDPDFPDRCQKMFNRLSHVLDNSKYLAISQSSPFDPNHFPP